MLKKMGPATKALIIAAVLALGYFTSDSWLPMRKIVSARVAKNVSLSDTEVGTNKSADVKVVLPSGRPATRSAMKEVRFDVMKWGAQSALFLANGGPVTLTDSLIGKRGAYLKISNEDDTEQMKNMLTAFAKAWAKDGGKGNPEDGVQAVIVMGDGGPAYIASWNEILRKVCKDSKLPERDCEVVVAGAVGSSYGEDQVFVPVEWKDNPQMALGKNTKRGGLISAYFWDGDHLLGLFWAQINGLKVNPDEKTWDPDAVNFLNAKDFLDAVEKYNTEYCESRSVVKNGKLTGEKKDVCVEGTATWTPGDTNIAKGRRDTLVSAISTKENRNQMASTVLTIRGWEKQHSDMLGAIFAGTSEAADMIKASDVALNKATELALAVYKGQGGLTPKEWAALYKGIKHRNKLGYDVQFGGSRVWNNADAIEYYGLNGGANLYAAVYEQYGAMVADLAPSVIKKLQPVGEILELDGLLKAKELLGNNVGKADKVSFTEGAVTEVVGNANYSINFEINSDKVQGDSLPTIQKIYRQLATGSLKADIVGHTDNTGSADLNRDLSRRRAESVRREILAIARGSIADVRLNASGVGPDKPLNPGADQNSTSERAKNRRVEITLGR